MNNSRIFIALLLLTTPLFAAELRPVAGRLTDETNRADQATLKTVATRIAALPEDSSARATAAAWLLVAQTEYDRTNRTAFVVDALARAERALAPAAPTETALDVHRAWIEQRRATAGFRAALPLLAAAETLEISGSSARAKPAKSDARPAYVNDRLHALQTRLAALWDAGLSSESYAFAQAQHWLDFATDEYNARDRSGIVDSASAEAEKHIAALEARAALPPAALASLRLRPDLRTKAAALRPADLASQLTAREPRLAALARLEIQLRWAAYEDAQRGWRAARPLLQLAERFALAAAAPSAP